MLAVGVGNNIREKELETIASWPTRRNIFYANDYDALEGSNFVNGVLDAVCNSKWKQHLANV